MDNKEKLLRFKEDCLSHATREANEINEEIDKKVKEELEEELKQYIEKEQVKQKKEYKRLEQEYNAKIYDIDNKTKMLLMQKEKELINDLKQSVIAKLNEFTNTEIYMEYLLNNVEQAIQQTCDRELDYQNVVIYLTQKDITKLGARIQEKISNAVIEQIGNDYIGGSKCFNKSTSIAVDNTLKLKLEQALEMIG